MLGMFRFKYREISCSPCFPRTFFIRSLLLMEKSVLLLMAFGSFVANHNFLQNKSILTTMVGLELVSLSQEGKCLSVLGWMLKRLQRGKTTKTGK